MVAGRVVKVTHKGGTGLTCLDQGGIGFVEGPSQRGAALGLVQTSIGMVEIPLGDTGLA